MKRPSNLEHATLTDWAAWYDQCGKPYVKPSQQLDIDGLPLEKDINNDDNNDDDNEEQQNQRYQQKNKKRSKTRIIRSVCLNKEVDSEKHYCELIMLFTSWRNDVTDLSGHHIRNITCR